MSNLFPTVRMRRLRKTETLRGLIREHAVTPNDLILPIFVEEEIDAHAPISSMPGVMRIPEKKLGDEIKALHKDGIKAVMMFGVSHHKDSSGSDSWKKDGLVSRMVKRAKDAAPSLSTIWVCKRFQPPRLALI
jgi:porphobilinogen synthase